jgi:Tol biopolymer transport system component
VWTPDGHYVIYGRPRPGTGWDIFRKPWDNSGSEEGVVTRTQNQVPSGGNPSADGRLLAYAENNSPGAAQDLRVLSLKDDSDSIFANTAANEMNGTFSPDARFLAYVSDSLGRDEVFIRPLTGSGDPRRVSVDGGVEPHWAPNGELFFRNGNRMLVTKVTTQPNLVFDSPRILFQGPYALNPIQDRDYDVTADGRRFLMVQQADASESTVRLNVVVNWLEELKATFR